MSKKKPPTKKKVGRKKASTKKKVPTKKAAKLTKKKSAIRKATDKKIKPKGKVKKTKPKAKPKKAKTPQLAKPKSTASASRSLRQKKVRLDSTTTKIRDKLIQNRGELLAIIRSNQTIERDATEANFSNEIDLASNLEGREMMFQLTSRDRSELKMIEEALYKIDTGTYGTCEACAKQIGARRLQILPLSTLCIKCKESMEQS